MMKFAKRAKLLLFIVKYANLWGFCCRRRRGCLSSLLTSLLMQTRVVVRKTETHQIWKFRVAVW